MSMSSTKVSAEFSGGSFVLSGTSKTVVLIDAKSRLAYVNPAPDASAPAITQRSQVAEITY